MNDEELDRIRSEIIYSEDNAYVRLDAVHDYLRIIEEKHTRKLNEAVREAYKRGYIQGSIDEKTGI